MVTKWCTVTHTRTASSEDQRELERDTDRQEVEMVNDRGRGKDRGRGRSRSGGEGRDRVDNRVCAHRDNLYEGNLPAFTGMVNVTAEGEEPSELFSSLFPDTLIEEITFQSNLYARQQGKENFLT